MAEVDISAVAGIIGHPSRARVLDVLLTGRAFAAGELARLVGGGRSTISEHLALLVGAGLVEVVRQGRHRYYRLAGPDVARALEALAVIAPPAPATSLRRSSHAAALGVARTCYDHLAGVAGVRLHDALVARAWVVPTVGGYELTDPGARSLADLGLDVELVRSSRRASARACLDWTERTEHLAGALGAELLRVCLADGWVVRRSHGSRALRVTDRGSAALTSLEDPAARAPRSPVP